MGTHRASTGQAPELPCSLLCGIRAMRMLLSGYVGLFRAISGYLGLISGLSRAISGRAGSPEQERAGLWSGGWPHGLLRVKRRKVNCAAARDAAKAEAMAAHRQLRALLYGAEADLECKWEDAGHTGQRPGCHQVAG